MRPRDQKPDELRHSLQGANRCSDHKKWTEVCSLLANAGEWFTVLEFGKELIRRAWDAFGTERIINLGTKVVHAGSDGVCACTGKKLKNWAPYPQRDYTEWICTYCANRIRNTHDSALARHAANIFRLLAPLAGDIIGNHQVPNPLPLFVLAVRTWEPEVGILWLCRRLIYDGGTTLNFSLGEGPGLLVVGTVSSKDPMWEITGRGDVTCGPICPDLPVVPEDVLTELPSDAEMAAAPWTFSSLLSKSRGDKYCDDEFC
jgi:hypothetical protein